MPEFKVSWHIDVEAEDERAAAEEALKIQRDPTSIATIFAVRRYKPRLKNRVLRREGRPIQIDLSATADDDRTPKNLRQPIARHQTIEEDGGGR